jgi:hypothetical protein
MTKIEGTPVQAELVKLIQLGGHVDVRGIYVSTNAEARALLAPFVSLYGSKLEHTHDRYGGIWRVKNFDNPAFQFISVWVNGKRPDHG